MRAGERVAIVGVGGIFAGSPDPERLWANVAGAVDATREVPPGRWHLPASEAFDPRVAEADRVYSTRGGFVEGFRLDPEGLDLDPELIGRLDPMFHLALHAGRQAWRDAVIEGLDRDRVGVVIGNIVLPTEATSALARETLGRTFAERLGVPDEEAGATEPLNAYAAGLPAGLLARALGLRGGSYTLDAACASSLYALKLAADELLEGRADAMITGGLSRPDPLYTQMGFSQLRALSASGRASPFDARGDGLVVGEGAGMFVLKRLGDALRQGDAIYGVIAGVGLSNDVDGGLLAPSSEGQLRAMRAAYERAGWDPRDVDLIECHATGTPVGDAVEFRSLRELWGPSGWSPGGCAISSVKSNIGHALTAAGAAGLLKVLLAFRNETLPPTANFASPSPSLDYDGGPFRVLTEPQPWPRRADGRPRRAAISGFGFGGINAHALIEEWIPGGPAPRPGLPAATPATQPVTPPPRPSPARGEGGREEAPLAIVGMSAHVGPFRGLRAFQERVLGGDIPGEPHAPRNWWGVPESDWYRRTQHSALSTQHSALSTPLGTQHSRGYYLDEVAIPAGRFRIPPKELEEMLPQQSLALRVAAEAIADAGWDDRVRARAGVVVGIALDLNTTNFQLRWSILKRARRWADRLGLELSDEEFERWTRALRDASGPPLTANRTMGALGGLVASRIAREFRVGGPSFTVSGEETSGARALDVAARLLRRGEIDEAIVAAVDLTGDVRMVLAADRVRPFSPSGVARPLAEDADGMIPADGAVAVVLKRLDDAVRDGDRIYAVVRGVGSSGGSDAASYSAAARRALDEAGVDPSAIGYVEANGSGRPDEDRVEAEALADLGRGRPGPSACALGSSCGDVGHAGAASGLVSVVKAALVLHQQILPPLRGTGVLRPELAGDRSPYFAPRGPQFWLRDRDDGPRRATVASLGTDGNVLHVVLEAFEPLATTTTDDRLQPLGMRRSALFAVEADDRPGLLRLLDELDAMAGQHADRPIEALARLWWRRHRNRPEARLGLAFVADGVDTLRDRIAEARRDPDGVLHTALGEGGLAFVFPGMGNQFAGMGRDLSALWPEVLRAQDAESGRLRSQMAPGTFWNDDPPASFDDHRAPILGQVALGAMVSDLLRGFGVEPGAAIGYSLGESAALFALRAWTGRDEILRRMERSPLFATELAGPCDAARRAWGLAEGEPVDWVAGVVPYPAEAVRRALDGRDRAYLLIVNTPRETVVGGRREAVNDLVRALGGRFIPLPTVSTVHCEVARQVEDAYRAMHLLPTTAPPGVRFYSGARGVSYVPDRESAADAITAHAIHGVDFPAVVLRAYDDGIRAFVEVGPGGSCTRMIGKILGDRPHLTRSACLAGRDALATILDLLAALIAARVRVDLAPLYGREARAVGLRAEEAEPRGRLLKVAVGGRPFEVPRPPSESARVAGVSSSRPRSDGHRAGVSTTGPQPPDRSNGHPMAHLASDDKAAHLVPAGAFYSTDGDALTRQVLTTEASKAEAHGAFLRVSGNLSQTISNQLGFQIALIEALMATPAEAGPPTPALPHEGGGGLGERPSFEGATVSAVETAPALDRAQCLEFAVGSIAAVLGPEFAAIDAHPTRVRLPDEPLMLVDRILAIEGEPRSLSSGRVITEHDIFPGDWYLDGGKIPTCIAVESGQADLFLSGYLGIDFVTKGLAVYRLLDAAVTFHRGLPGPGEVIRYDIRIANFFRQGETHLFRFHFEATVGGEPLMTMRDGCAGFFTAEALAAGRGIVQTGLDRRPRPGARPDDWDEFVPVAVEAFDDDRVEALRRGDLASAFGASFAGLSLRDPVRLPGGRMTLVHRVTHLDPSGGRFGLGLIRAEADIHPDDWFMTCHFVDDRVMPGTLLYECCLHTLRIHLMRMGWIGERDEVAWEPVPGVSSRLKCRGQVIETTKTVTYEVSIKELGYRPEPFAIVDALMYADGKAIVEITDMSLRLTGQTREGLRRIWSASGAAPHPNPPPQGGRGEDGTSIAQASGPKPAIYDHASILAFAVGRPSEGFGERYRTFDEGRFIARLPGPPYQFLDRVTEVRAEPWTLAAGGEVEAQYDVPPDAWYFAADRQARMPFAVLLEVALQPCGWFAAYMGSALTSDEPLKFRNLGGTATQLGPVSPRSGTLTTAVRVTKVSRSGGMIIQHFDFEVSAAGAPVYRGDTYFGFFREEALAEQVGLRDASPYRPSPDERARSRAFGFPTVAPFPDDRLRMIDRVDDFIADGGPHGLGFIEGSQPVDPSSWYFKAHFFQDPVCPGSLGLESLLQLLKVVAAERWGVAPGSAFESPGEGDTHRWTYRGQVIPTSGRVATQAVVTAVDDRRRRLRAAGMLSVDGRPIFRMDDFTLGLGAGT
jgi:acyl transferase domain-containing protein/3-hydroxymyristoyl/3-hydroxydecanoyl-(acyl carrier protein) dehydratase